MKRQKLRLNAALVIQRAWAASQQRFIQRCLTVLERVKATMVIQRWWEKVQLSRRQHHQLKMSSDAKKRMSTDLSSNSNTSYGPQLMPKMPPCDPLSLLCNFNFGALSAGMVSPTSISNMIMPWGNLVAVAVDVDVDVEKTKTNKEKSPLRTFQSAIRIQRFWREERARRTKEGYFQSVAAAWIQCIWRGYSVRKQRKQQLACREAAALCIKTAWRSIQTRRVEGAAAVKLQAQWRMVECQSEYALVRLISVSGVTCLQAAWRRHAQQCQFLQCQIAAIIIQQAFRAAAKRKQSKSIRGWFSSKWSKPSFPGTSK